MPTTITVKGQVTIPKHVRTAVGLRPGDRVDFSVNDAGEVVVRKAGRTVRAARNRFQSARGAATIQWRTDDLMALLRPAEE